jgi:3-hydroxyacyl-[acyl-carrier-protein] dehydratase
MPPEAHLDVSALDLTRVLADREAIRRVNPHRYELELLDAVVYLDRAAGLIAGYKDVLPDAFWVRGHFPDYALMPGVLQCEAAAQLASYYMSTNPDEDHTGEFIGLGGLEEVRFRGQVRPGDRLVLVGKMLKAHRRQTTFGTQGFVNGSMVFQAEIIGMWIRR